MRTANHILFRLLDGTGTLGRPGNRGKHNIKIYLYLIEIGYEVIKWIHLAQVKNQKQAIGNIALNLRVQYNMAHSLT
jgi:hypothetical protein